MAGSIERNARLAVDIGGTFTDLVLEVGGRIESLKILTTPQRPERAVIDGSMELLSRAGLGPADLRIFVHGTTLATNAIIERKGVRTALVATEGFRDVLDIADEGRYNQYDIFLERPTVLVERPLRFTVPERMDARGDVLKPLDEASVRAVARRLAAEDVKSVAVSLIHAYANDAHERRVREILLEENPDFAVSLSSEVCPEIREYERTSTTVANAYVQPLMASYLTRLGDELASLGFDCPLYLMTSGGGLTTLATAIRFPIRLVESGPAGGAIMASHVSAMCGEAKVVSFDMGGTTAKICLIEDGVPQMSRAFEVDRRDRFMKGSGFPLRIPVIEMVEIGAGGGSIAGLDAMRRIGVGPESAGSEPGPACYGRGGTSPTVTDADLVLGRIDPERFAGGRIDLDAGRSRTALAAAVGDALGLDAQQAAFSVAEVVDENMANAARVHAVERGKAINDYTLIAFGGAAPLHVARLAEKLGISRVIVPPNAGVGSAVGFLRAPVAFEVVRSSYARLDALDMASVRALLGEMREEARAVIADGAGGEALLESATAFMRYRGQGHEIAVPIPAVAEGGALDVAALRAAFEAEYERLFFRTIPDCEVEVLTWTLTLSTATRAAPPRRETPPRSPAAVARRREVYDFAAGSFVAIDTYWRPDLAPGASLSGPAIIAEVETSTFVSASFDAAIDASNCIVLTRKEA